MIKTVLKKILPFLNEHIPPEMAEKAINKVSPQLGKFLKRGVEQGLPLAGGLNFIKNQFLSEKEPIDQNLRPGQRAAQAEQGREKQTGQTLKNAAQLAGSAALAGPVGAAVQAGTEMLGDVMGSGGAPQGAQPQPEDQPLPQEKAIEDKNNNIQQLYQLAQTGKTQGNEFLKYASQLIKSQDIEDLDTFSNFYKWWNAKPAQKRGSPREEFEMFRHEIGNALKPQSKAALQEEVLNPPQSQGKGQEALIAILQKLQQSRGQG